MSVQKYKRRHWAVYDTDGILVCVCVYKKGAREVVRRLTLSLLQGSTSGAEALR